MNSMDFGMTTPAPMEFGPTKQERRIAALEQALEPFAKLAGDLQRRPDSTVVASTAGGEITAGDVRRAAAALA